MQAGRGFPYCDVYLLRYRQQRILCEHDVYLEVVGAISFADVVAGSVLPVSPSYCTTGATQSYRRRGADQLYAGSDAAERIKF